MPKGVNSQNGRVYLNSLRLARELRGWSQRELADRAGLKQAQISRLESGKREPRLSTVRALADALGVDPDRIFPKDNGAELRRALTEHFEGSVPRKRRRKATAQ